MSTELGIRKTICLHTALALLIAMHLQVPLLYSSANNIDCLYLLALLDTSLDHVVANNPLGKVMAMYLVNITVPGELKDLHVEAYSTFLDYYRALVEVKNDSQNSILIYSVLTRLNTISKYAGRVKACSHDQEAASALVARISMKLKNLEEHLYKVYIQYEKSREYIVINPYKELYYPNEVVELFVSREIPLSAVEVYAWPSLIKIYELAPYIYNTTHYYIIVELPKASLVENLGLKSRDLPLAFYLKLLNGSYMLAWILKVEYRIPSIQLSVPSTVKYRDPIFITILSDGNYSVRLYVNNLDVSATVLLPGSNTLQVDCTRYCGIGLNNLRLCVNATNHTVSHCIDKLIYVEPLYPRIRVITERFYVAWFGYIKLLIVNEDRVDAYVTLNNYAKRTFYIPRDSVLEIPVYTGFLPVQVLSPRVEIKPLDELYDPLNLKLEIYVVNIPVVLLLILASVALVPLVSGYERGFMLTITGSWKRMQKLPRRLGDLVKSTILKPYELGLGSRIAVLYYELLRKLKLGLPLVNETLREHYNIVSQYIPWSLKMLLWKFLLLVEKDLYSSKKPTYREAEEVYYGALNAVSEE